MYKQIKLMTSKQELGSILGPDIIINIKRVLKLRSISIKIYKKNVNIDAPFFLTKNLIDQLIYKKINWIKKQLVIQEKKFLINKKKYVDGDYFFYLGKKYKLKIIISKKNCANIQDSYLIVNIRNISNTLQIKKNIEKWFREKSLNYFEEQTYYFAKKNNLNVNAIKVREYKARWGSCSTNGDISFNWKLIMAPPWIIQYVIIHELIHIKEHNHSTKYWEHVRSIYPNIKDAKEWLMYNGQNLNI